MAAAFGPRCEGRNWVVQVGTSARAPESAKACRVRGAPLARHMVKRPDSWVRRLDLRREGDAPPAAISLARGDFEALHASRAEWLHPEEEHHFQHAGVPKRQADYLRGRFCAKTALGALVGGLVAREVCVAGGVFGQPVVRGPGVANQQVSIAHSGDWAAALAFDEAHPMAIDIEAHDAHHEATIRREVSTAELTALARAGIAEPLSLTLLWAAKESLAKVLRTGLMAPLSFYEVAAVEPAEGGGVTCEYRHFTQYKSQCGILGKLAVAIALPRKSFLQLDWRNVTVEAR